MILFLLSLAFAEDGAPAGGVALRDLMVGMPACTTSKVATPTLDLENGCVDGLCSGRSTLPQFIELYGEPDRCDIPDIGRNEICTFGGHVSVHLEEDSDNVKTIFVQKDHPARTADGLGIGSSLVCFVERFGASATSADVRVRDGRLTWDHLQFRDPRMIVSVSDTGHVDRIQLASRGTRMPKR